MGVRRRLWQPEAGSEPPVAIKNPETYRRDKTEDDVTILDS
jgi:hypothetical protein